MRDLGLKCLASLDMRPQTKIMSDGRYPGETVQYIGETDGIFTKGYFYMWSGDCWSKLVAQKGEDNSAEPKEYICKKCGATIKYKQQECDYCGSLISWM